MGSSADLSQASSTQVFLPEVLFLVVQIWAKLETCPLQPRPLFPGTLERLRCAADWRASLEELQRRFARVVFESKPPAHLRSIPHLFLPFSPVFYKNIFAVVETIHPAFIPTQTYFVPM